MSVFDSLLSQAGSNLDVNAIAERTGLDPAMAQQALAALTAAHGQDGDTVETAAAQTGIGSDTLNQVLAHIGGDGMLGQLASGIAANPGVVQGVLGTFAGPSAGGIGSLLGGFFKSE